jgi:hypothetical protein
LVRAEELGQCPMLAPAGRSKHCIGIGVLEDVRGTESSCPATPKGPRNGLFRSDPGHGGVLTSPTAVSERGRRGNPSAMSDAETPTPAAGDDRLADTDTEGLLHEQDPIPDDDRVVPEDVNEFLPDEDPEDV